MERIGILGAGAWGTALALTAHRAGRQIMLQAHEAEVVEAINRDHENPFLPGVRLDPAICATNDSGEAAAFGDVLLLTAPAQFLRSVVRLAAGGVKSGMPVVICAKGIEQNTCALMSEVVGEELPQALLAVLSGPSFAAEVARELPTAVTLACADRKLQRTLPAALGTKYFRIYSTDDVIGVEIGGAVKNVLAIACGIVAGRGLGDNSRAALITRGLAEMARLAIVKGARAETLMGLAGVGDLVLTCNALQSRNYSLGVALGEGATLETVLSQRTSVAEGVFTSASVTALAHRLDVDMPICSAVDQVLNQNADLDTIIDGLLSRPFRSEDLAGSSIEKL
jgi:glycerol-3-phosphate dehydrogenase (NAD(P)+)